jgi:hypothetical protein
VEAFKTCHTTSKRGLSDTARETLVRSLIWFIQCIFQIIWCSLALFVSLATLFWPNYHSSQFVWPFCSLTLFCSDSKCYDMRCLTLKSVVVSNLTL